MTDGSCETADAAAGLWSFAVALYAAPGVSAACLALQDRCGADVPLLLAAAWLGARGAALDAAGAARVEAEVAEWRREVIVPLRAVRRRLKTGPAPAPDAATEALRTIVKRAELDAEQVQIVRMEALAVGIAAHPTAGGSGLARANLGVALALWAAPDAEASAALDAIAGACAPGGVAGARGG